MHNKLKQNRLFSAMSASEIKSILGCLSAKRRQYQKGSIVFYSGDVIREIGIILSGSLHLISEDFLGNSSLISRIAENDVFGEVFAGLSLPLSFDVVAAQDCDILFLDINRVLTSCSSSCRFHQRLIKNLMELIAQKNLELSKKVEILSQRTIRKKLLKYLSSQKLSHGSGSFDIPFNRQQLADYLSVDRSSMTVELCKMRDEGLLRFNKNHFELL